MRICDFRGQHGEKRKSGKISGVGRWFDALFSDIATQAAKQKWGKQKAEMRRRIPRAGAGRGKALAVSIGKYRQLKVTIGN